MELLIGTAKEDITCFIPGIGMMGYGQFHNTVKEIATPLWGRVLFMDHGSDKFILVHLEQAFVTFAIKEEVIKRLSKLHPEWKIGDANLAITAQHTHSAPGGYSHYPFYNFTIPGFQLKVFEKIVSSVISAIEEASRKKEKCTLKWGRHSIDPSKEIAFNRSIEAHALNPEARHSTIEEKHLAVDRTMEGLSFTNPEGKQLAFLNWFGVHCTSVSSYNQRIHHDNKGIAAELFEKSHPGTMAFFLQSAAGDVSPNFIWDKSTKLMRGKYKDQYENAAFNGELQFRESEKVPATHELKNEFEYHQLFLDMAKEVAPPAHGVAFFKGTAEGPGVSESLGNILAMVSRSVKRHKLAKHPELHLDYYKAHGNKDIILDHRTGEFLGIPLAVWKKLPPLPEPSVEALRKTARANALETRPWAPTILPFQVLRLGQLLLAFVPGEITVVSARRLKKQLLHDLKETGIEEVFVTSYSNAFMGYITTPEEYDKQCYEGGHTIYGRQTLDGILLGFSYLSDLMKGKSIRSDLPKEPFHFPADELARRSV